MSWIQTAKAGDKVTRFPDEEIPEDDDFEYDVVVYPEYGAVYTIRDVVPFADGGVGLLLCEIINPVHEYKDYDGSIVIEECSFDAAYFRPVEPRKTDISFAHEILRKATKQVEDLA